MVWLEIENITKRNAGVILISKIKYHEPKQAKRSRIIIIIYYYIVKEKLYIIIHNTSKKIILCMNVSMKIRHLTERHMTITVF